MMLAARLYDRNDLRLVNIPVPEVGEGEVLLEVKAAAICGTDLRMLKNGANGISPVAPRTLGHELSGIVAKVGRKVETYHEGMRISVAPNIGCGVCNACIRGNGHLCKDYRALGINLDGGFAQFMLIPREAVSRGNIVALPDQVSFEEASINEALSCVFNGFERCDIRPGDTVLVIGAGPIGIMHGMLAKMGGASRVFINDLSDERLEVCKEIEPTFTTIRSDGMKEAILAETSGEGVDVCITACPAPAAQIIALELASMNGRINFFGGLPADRQEVTLNTNLIHYKQLMVTGTTRASVLQFRKTLGFISAGVLDVRRLISNRIPLEEVERGFKLAMEARGLKNVLTMD
jgi:L-iditol 2-dehydrogenase